MPIRTGPFCNLGPDERAALLRRQAENRIRPVAASGNNETRALEQRVAKHEERIADLEGKNAVLEEKAARLTGMVSELQAQNQVRRVACVQALQASLQALQASLQAHIARPPADSRPQLSAHAGQGDSVGEAGARRALLPPAFTAATLSLAALFLRARTRTA
eukprot:tig00021015_g17161.t1